MLYMINIKFFLTSKEFHENMTIEDSYIHVQHEELRSQGQDGHRAVTNSDPRRDVD